MAQLIQARTAPTLWPSKPRLLVARTDKYNYNLSEGLPIINDTADLSEGLPVINDTTNLSERLPVINNTSAKMICVVIFSINALMTCVVNDLCGFLFNQHLMTCGHWPVWPMTYVVAGLCG